MQPLLTDKPNCNHDAACIYLGVSATSLDDLLHSGELAGAKISRDWIIRIVDMDAYLSEQVRIQTAERREAWRNGTPAKVKTAVAEVRSKKTNKPDLSKYDEQLAA